MPPAAEATRTERPTGARRFTPTETRLILELHAKGTGFREIAKRLGCQHTSVSRLLARWDDTRALATARLHSGALDLAERVVAEANVEESLEVLDRLDVAPKKLKEAGSSIQVLVGVKLGDMQE